MNKLRHSETGECLLFVRGIVLSSLAVGLGERASAHPVGYYGGGYDQTTYHTNLLYTSLAGRGEDHDQGRGHGVRLRPGEGQPRSPGYIDSRMAEYEATAAGTDIEGLG